MPRNSTRWNRNNELSPAQSEALSAIIAGNSITRAAEIAAVDRSTMHRWLREDWLFQAHLNREKRELKEAIEAHLLKIAENAAEAVSEAVSGGDTRTALTVLKGLGRLSGESITTGHETPEILQEENDILEKEADAYQLLPDVSGRE
jgi:hypothetical protein